MLVLVRTPQPDKDTISVYLQTEKEKIKVATIRVLDIIGKKVRLGIEADPNQFVFLREELEFNHS
jgi:sRNA-binding carbon storage regulator CsrA